MHVIRKCVHKINVFLSAQIVFISKIVGFPLEGELLDTRNCLASLRKLTVPRESMDLPSFGATCYCLLTMCPLVPLVTLHPGSTGSFFLAFRRIDQINQCSDLPKCDEATDVFTRTRVIRIIQSGPSCFASGCADQVSDPGLRGQSVVYVWHGLFGVLSTSAIIKWEVTMKLKKIQRVCIWFSHQKGNSFDHVTMLAIRCM